MRWLPLSPAGSTAASWSGAAAGESPPSPLAWRSASRTEEWVWRRRLFSAVLVSLASAGSAPPLGLLAPLLLAPSRCQRPPGASLAGETPRCVLLQAPVAGGGAGRRGLSGCTVEASGGGAGCGPLAGVALLAMLLLLLLPMPLRERRRARAMPPALPPSPPLLPKPCRPADAGGVKRWCAASLVAAVEEDSAGGGTGEELP